MMTAIVGINWGDEGKGRMVDLFSSDYDIICRYQGGNNAGHTVVNEDGKFIFNLLPSGVLRKGTINILGNGMVIDIEHLTNEIDRLKEQGIEITPKNLKISEHATICMPYHKLQDCAEEDRLKDKKFGSTRRGIAPAYSDKFMKKSIRICDLKDFNILESKLKATVEWKNLLLAAYGEKVDYKEMLAWLKKYSESILPYVDDVREFLLNNSEKNIMFEAQLGSLRDIEHGIVPYTTSSSTLASYATTGAGVPELKLDSVIGIMKAYSSCVGEGPFACEEFGEFGDKLRDVGQEYGAATGRPRRVGGFDIVASRYGVALQGAETVALTKLDTLSGLGDLPVVVAYEIDGESTETFPTDARLERAKPIIEYKKGWDEDINKCRKFEDLPQAAQDYVLYLESKVGAKIKYVSVGAERESIIIR